MRNYFFSLVLFIFTSLFSFSAMAQSKESSYSFDNMWAEHPFYFGATLGYGSTDWGMVTVHCDVNDPQCGYTVPAASPIDADDRGAVVGAFMGYEIQPHFAVEANYLHFPQTTYSFYDEFNYYEVYEKVKSDTNAAYIVSKFMVQMGKTGLRGFANAGIDFTYRYDALADTIHVEPTFGIGVNYVFRSRWMAELGFQYIAGFGVAHYMPLKDFIPFLNSLHAKLSYRI